jgi:hypothetical protein
MKKVIYIITLLALTLSQAYALEADNSLSTISSATDKIDVTCNAGSNNVKARIFIGVNDVSFASVSFWTKNLNTGVQSPSIQATWGNQGVYTPFTNGVGVSGSQTVRLILRKDTVSPFVTPYHWFIQCYSGTTPKGVATMSFAQNQ